MFSKPAEPGDFKLTVRSKLPGRERWDIPALKHNPKLAKALELVLRSEIGIRNVIANPLTGRLLLEFHPDKLTQSSEQTIRTAFTLDAFSSFDMRVRRNGVGGIEHMLLGELVHIALKGMLMSGACICGGTLAAAVMIPFLHTHRSKLAPARRVADRVTAGRTVIDQPRRIEHHHQRA
jgi:hypothetical protein